MATIYVRQLFEDSFVVYIAEHRESPDYAPGPIS